MKCKRPDCIRWKLIGRPSCSRCEDTFLAGQTVSYDLGRTQESNSNEDVPMMRYGFLPDATPMVGGGGSFDGGGASSSWDGGPSSSNSSSDSSSSGSSDSGSCSSSDSGSGGGSTD